jgi:malate dehydrogenase (oxaloacetate-decarboxylating)(NADP+)
VPDSVVAAYGGAPLKFGADYFIPKPFDPRALWWVAPAVAQAAMRSGVARREVDIVEYRETLVSRSSNAAYSIMRNISRAAAKAPQRIVFPHAANPKILRAVTQILEEGIARPILLGRPTEIETMCKDLDLPILDDVDVVDPRTSDAVPGYAQRLFDLRQRKGMTLPMAKNLVTKSNYYASLMVERGHADGMVTGLMLNYPESVRPALQVMGLLPQVKVAVGMYMMVLKNSVKFFGDTVFNIDPDAEALADITVQMSDAVGALGVGPRVAMISYSNFGSVEHPEVRKIQRALDIVRDRRPDLEIDGEMRPEIALDPERRREHYPFSRLTRSANVLVFPSLAAGNAAYQTLKALGGASAVGPIILGVAHPIAALPIDASVDDIVNITAHVVTSAQRLAQPTPLRA